MFPRVPGALGIWNRLLEVVVHGSLVGEKVGHLRTGRIGEGRRAVVIGGTGTPKGVGWPHRVVACNRLALDMRTQTGRGLEKTRDLV